MLCLKEVTAGLRFCKTLGDSFGFGGCCLDLGLEEGEEEECWELGELD